MSKQTLVLTIVPALLKALGIPGDAERAVDYFDLLGVTREAADPTQVERNLKDRTRALRQWQNSPEYGPIVVQLLPVMHRAAKILMDPRRREAYRKELALEEQGDTMQGMERFRQMARVAFVGKELSQQDKASLQEAAKRFGIGNTQVQKIVEQVRAEYNARRVQAAPAAAEPDSEWEFHIAGKGETELMAMLQGLKTSGGSLVIGPKKLLEEVHRFGIETVRAHQIVKEQMTEWFKDMITTIAGEGAINDAQMQMLLPKAANFGLSDQEAYDIISEYSLSAVVSDDLRHQFELAEQSLTLDDFEEILNQTTQTWRHQKWLDRMREKLGPTFKLGPAIGAVVALALVIVVAIALMGRGSRGSSVASGAASRPNGTSATPAPTPARTPEAPARPPLPPRQPDPVSGLLRMDPQKPGDPPAFEIRISEITNENYAQYIKATLENPPPDWPGANGNLPEDARLLPVVNVTWKEASAYCLWIADRNGWKRGSARLPTWGEFERATRGVTIRGHGNPQAPDYWDVAQLWSADRARPVMTTPWDRILTGRGQMYDMIGNVAEWGNDQQGGQNVVLGGSFGDNDHNFNAMSQRWFPADSRRPWIGFRYVHVLD
jgi:formylglycine-generating enzyme required for sulfatase activity